MPTTTNGLPYPSLTDSNNPPADIQALAMATDSAYGKNVANAAALPAAGAFLGQEIWLVDVKGYAVWSGSAWNYDIAATAPTFSGLWVDIGSGDITRASVVNGNVTITIGATKAAASTAGEIICNFPARFRPVNRVRIAALNGSNTRPLSLNTNGDLTNDVAQGAGVAAMVGSASFAAVKQ